MAYLTIEDLTGSIESVCFPAIYERIKPLLNEPQPVRVEGKVDVTETDDGKITKVVVNRVSILETDKVIPQKVKARVKLSTASRLSPILNKYKGRTHPVEIVFEAEDGTLFKCQDELWIGDHRGSFTRELLRLNK